MPAWLLYTLARLGLFAVSFTVLFLLLGVDYWWAAALLATLIAFAVSYLALSRLRARMAEQLAAARQREATEGPSRGVDELVEDDAVEDQRG